MKIRGTFCFAFTQKPMLICISLYLEFISHCLRAIARTPSKALFYRTGEIIVIAIKSDLAHMVESVVSITQFIEPIQIVKPA